MNEKLRRLVKKIMVGAVASISTTFISTHAKINEIKNTHPSKQTELTKYDFNQENESPQLVLKKPSKFGLISNIFHRSHRSHSSHSSHYSSHNTPKEEKPKTEEKQSLFQEKKKEPRQSQGTMENQMIYELGSRVLEKGMKGTDVAELQDILNKKGYKVNLSGEFGTSTEEAVEKFQKDKQIDITGKVDVLTLYYLKKKD